ncbi:MAG: hypothetical protein GXO98_06835 [Nitrospirae bacterium]|nr:hypothetical protein [Nitrospirota bacterium]
MKRRLAFIITILVVGLWGCADRYFPLSREKSELENLLPPSSFSPGWRREKKPSSYNPGNLYEYIDGAAELYLDYGFKKLVTALYLYEGKKDYSLIIDVYDMGSELNAFGIHSSYRGSEAQLLEIGSEAYLTDYTLAFYKGKYFVYLQAGNPSGENKTSMKKAAQIVAERIPGQAEQPRELSYLPGENLLKNTSIYVPKGLLGYHFLPGGLQAEYQLGKEKILLFVGLSPSSREAREAFQGYVEQIKKAGKNLAFQTGLAEEAFFADDSYYGKVLVARHKRFLVGVVNLQNYKEGESLLKATLKKIEIREE